MKKDFDKTIEEELLKNDFVLDDDEGCSLSSGWSQDWERYRLYLMKHDFGYWLIIGCHASVENPKMNIGSSNSAKEIIELRDSLKQLF